MSELENVTFLVAKAASRRRLQNAWSAFWKGVFISSLLCLVGIAIFKFTPLDESIIKGIITTVAVLPLASFLIGWIKAPSLLETARWIDQEAGLKERLSTALELADKGDHSEWDALILQDASKHAKEVQPNTLLPFSLPKIARWTLVTLLAGASLGFVPEYRSPELLEEQRQAEAIKDTGKNLSRLAKRSLEQKDPVLPATEQSLTAIDELGKLFQKQQLSREQALRDLAKISDSVADQESDLRKDPALKRIQQAARQNSGANQSLDSMQKEMADLQRQLDNKNLDSDKVSDLKDQLQKMQEEAASMANNGSQSNDSKMSEMANSMQSMMSEAEAMGINTSDLKSALEALKNADVDKFLKDLDKALANVEDMEKLAEKLGQMRQAMEKMGKDLPEQLEKGQASAAIQRLREMAKKLQSGQCTQKEADEIMKEISKSIDPSSPYGECQSHLQKASNNLQGGNKQQTSQNLADAADELEELMKKAGDLASLQEMMKALQASKMAVGNCQNWGQCLSQCNGNGSKPGGKPGRGVGTWGDDSLTGFFPNGGLWDNTGIESKNLDPKGLTDRGDGAAPEGMTSSKVKGDFAAGAPMPSITLKNVSIKGTSKLEYEEAVTAAQSDAQSALSEERVPKAYRGTVRDYFDDLK